MPRECVAASLRTADMDGCHRLRRVSKLPVAGPGRARAGMRVVPGRARAGMRAVLRSTTQS